MQRTRNNNSKGTREAVGTVRPTMADSPLTMGGRNVVLPPLMASLIRESEEGMWYTCGVL
jgi:hypothetical protein